MFNWRRNYVSFIKNPRLSLDYNVHLNAGGVLSSIAPPPTSDWASQNSSQNYFNYSCPSTELRTFRQFDIHDLTKLICYGFLVVSSKTDPDWFKLQGERHTEEETLLELKTGQWEKLNLPHMIQGCIYISNFYCVVIHWACKAYTLITKLIRKVKHCGFKSTAC